MNLKQASTFACWFHRWTVSKTETLPSPYEQMTSDGPLTRFKGHKIYFEKPVIVYYVCDRCGTEKVERI
jgi:hypothetical protein